MNAKFYFYALYFVACVVAPAIASVAKRKLIGYKQ